MTFKRSAHLIGIAQRAFVGVAILAPHIAVAADLPHAPHHRRFHQHHAYAERRVDPMAANWAEPIIVGPVVQCSNKLMFFGTHYTCGGDFDVTETMPF